MTTRVGIEGLFSKAKIIRFFLLIGDPVCTRGVRYCPGGAAHRKRKKKVIIPSRELKIKNKKKAQAVRVVGRGGEEKRLGDHGCELRPKPKGAKDRLIMSAFFILNE